MTQQSSPVTWEVEVRVNGESHLTIGHNHLAGNPEVNEYIVEKCALHLLSFIGRQHNDVAAKEPVRNLQEEAMDCYQFGKVGTETPMLADAAATPRAPKVRTSHHRNKEEAARLQKLVDDRCAPDAAQQAPEYILPCNVHLDPATTISAGCKLSTLLNAIKLREGEDWKKFSSMALPSITREAGK